MLLNHSIVKQNYSLAEIQIDVVEGRTKLGLRNVHPYLLFYVHC